VRVILSLTPLHEADALFPMRNFLWTLTGFPVYKKVGKQEERNMADDNVKVQENRLAGITGGESASNQNAEVSISPQESMDAGGKNIPGGNYKFLTK
jgi:hypothetical protein